jgi:hypothetical protein
MKCARLISLALLAFFLVSCGSSSPAKKIDGVWNASLQNPDGSVVYTFTATLTQSTGSTVNVNSFGFTSPAPCFAAPLGQSATFTASGRSGGYETGPFGMSIGTGLMMMQEKRPDSQRYTQQRRQDFRYMDPHWALRMLWRRYLHHDRPGSVVTEARILLSEQCLLAPGSCAA